MSKPPHFCLNCFAAMTPEAEVCPACGQRPADLAARDYRDKLLHALHHPLSEVRMRAIIALGWRAEPEVAHALADCALRNPRDVVEALAIVKSLQALPAGRHRDRALRELHERHPAAAVRRAALAGMPPAKTRR
ncbi:MAG: HEAT repeat domain-containing protein [Burkholderiales bacterium]